MDQGIGKVKHHPGSIRFGIPRSSDILEKLIRLELGPFRRVATMYSISIKSGYWSFVSIPSSIWLTSLTIFQTPYTTESRVTFRSVIIDVGVGGFKVILMVFHWLRSINFLRQVVVSEIDSCLQDY